jgi:hypothetical protein
MADYEAELNLIIGQALSLSERAAHDALETLIETAGASWEHSASSLDDIRKAARALVYWEQTAAHWRKLLNREPHTLEVLK